MAHHHWSTSAPFVVNKLTHLVSLVFPSFSEIAAKSVLRRRKCRKDLCLDLEHLALWPSCGSIDITTMYTQNHRTNMKELKTKLLHLYTGACTQHPSSFRPTICSVSIDPRFFVHGRMHKDFTRSEAREVYSVSIVSFGAELGRSSIRLVFNRSHNIIKRFTSICFVIKSAGLTVTRIFSILSSWFFSFCCGQKYFISISLIAPLPLRRANLLGAEASVQIRT